MQDGKQYIEKTFIPVVTWLLINASYLMVFCAAKLSTSLVLLVLFTFIQEIPSREVCLGNLNLSCNGKGVYSVASN